jgi:hypothetical protein
MNGLSGTSIPPRLPESHGRIRGWLPVGLGVLLFCGAVVLYAFNPTEHPFYPRCWLYAVTGWQCPGCGGLRATHQLLHGNLAAAWMLNPLAVLLTPAGAWMAWRWTTAIPRAESVRLPDVGLRGVILLMIGLLVYGILRNLL